MLTLKGRTAVIDGGSGIHGVAIAKAFLEGGMNVCIVCSREPKAQKAVEYLDPDGSRYGDRLLPTWAGGTNGIESAYQKYGSVDVIVPLSGHEPDRTSVEEMDDKTWELVANGHISGCWKMLQKALPCLRESSAPRVLFFANDGAFTGDPASGIAYNSAKGAVVSMTMTAARIYARDGITVNCIAAGSAYNRSELGMAEMGQELPELLPEDEPPRRLPSRSPAAPRFSPPCAPVPWVPCGRVPWGFALCGFALWGFIP